MASLLAGIKVAVLVVSGFQHLEMTGPRDALQKAGATVHIVSPDKDVVHAWDCDIPKVTSTFNVDVQLDDANPADYDALIIPGGYSSPEEMRLNKKAIAFVQAFDAKPIAAICHGPMLLVSANMVRGKRLTAYPAVQEDLVNAGALWANEAVVRDGNLVTSRSPEDLEFFNRAIIDLLQELHKS